MTTLTMKRFSEKLGFKRVSNARFRMLLKQWEIEGILKPYQGGYRGHSTAHPKKVLLLQPLEFFQEKSVDKHFHVHAAELILKELGLKLRHVAQTASHKCSNCKGDIESGTNYATASMFLVVKLCPRCIRLICEGAKLSIKPTVIIKEEGR
jgi:hypothetical protein